LRNRDPPYLMVANISYFFSAVTCTTSILRQYGSRHYRTVDWHFIRPPSLCHHAVIASYKLATCPSLALPPSHFHPRSVRFCRTRGRSSALRTTQLYRRKIPFSVSFIISELISQVYRHHFPRHFYTAEQRCQPSYFIQKRMCVRMHVRVCVYMYPIKVSRNR